MPREQIKYIAINPQGEITGPIGDDAEFIKTALEIGLSRATDSPTVKGTWPMIRNMGYKIYRARIQPIEDVTDRR